MPIDVTYFNADFSINVCYIFMNERLYPEPIAHKPVWLMTHSLRTYWCVSEINANTHIALPFVYQSFSPVGFPLDVLICIALFTKRIHRTYVTYWNCPHIRTRCMIFVGNGVLRLMNSMLLSVWLHLIVEIILFSFERDFSLPFLAWFVLQLTIKAIQCSNLCITWDFIYENLWQSRAWNTHTKTRTKKASTQEIGWD